jgi:hypothetical protein
MLAAADGLAQGLLGQPEGFKDSQLRRLKEQAPAMHALVRAQLTEQRRKASEAMAGAPGAQQAAA